MAMEGRLARTDLERGLNYLKSKVAPLIEGPDGIAANCSRVICEYADRHPDSIDRTVALIGRAGSALPLHPVLSPATPPRRQDAQRPGRPALPG